MTAKSDAEAKPIQGKELCAPSDKPVFFYDGDCALCSAAAGKLKRLDKGQRIQLYSIAEQSALDRYGVDGQAAQKQAHLWLPLAEQKASQGTQQGETLAGAAALLQIARTLPLLWPAVPFLWLSLRLGFAQPLYEALARRRHRWHQPND